MSSRRLRSETSNWHQPFSSTSPPESHCDYSSTAPTHLPFARNPQYAMWIEAGNTAEEREAIRQECEDREALREECEDELASDLKRSGNQLRELEQSGIDSTLKLAYRYMTGDEVEEDRFEAVRCFKKVAGLGSMEGQTQLAKCYYYGWGAMADHVTAMYWFEEAASQGCLEAKHFLGLGYAYGQGVKFDSHLAQKYFVQASREFPKAKFMLAMTNIHWRYRYECDRKPILDLIYDAAREGDADASSVWTGFLFSRPPSGRYIGFESAIWARALLFAKGLELPKLQ